MPDPPHKHLRVQDLRRLRNLLFSSRRPVEGSYAGKHASPQRGRSLEFTDYRQYMPGDEVGTIDWKVFGRSDKLFVKLLEHQTDMTVHLLVDGSSSMDYRGFEGRKPEPDSKYDHACRMAAAIAFLMVGQQDRVSFGVARDGLAEFLKPQSSPQHLLGILQSMERVKPGGKAKLAEAVGDFIRRVPRRGLFIVFSDLLDGAEALLKNLSIHTQRGGEAAVFHVLHQDELKLPEIDDAVFIDSETDDRVSLNVPDIREGYEERLRRFLDTRLAACRGRGFDYQLVSTGVDYFKPLEKYLIGRAG